MKKQYGQILDILGESMVPIKGFPFSRGDSAYTEIRQRIAELMGLIDTFYNARNTVSEIDSVEHALITLMRLIEVMDMKKMSNISRSMFYRMQNGLTLMDQFTRKSYLEIFGTIQESTYFIVTSAVMFSHDIFLYSDVEEELNYRSPLDWTLALWNSLCYHRENFIKRCSDNQKFFEFLKLCCCVCKILTLMLKELENHGF